MIKVLIVDDEVLARDELKYLLQRTKENVQIEEAENIESAFDRMVDHKPDLLFLDIDLSGENGFDIAKRLNRMSDPPAIVFATAFDQYALKAFEVSALDYLTKPFDEERLLQTMQKFKKWKAIETQEPSLSEDKFSHNQKLAISVDESIVILQVDEIMYIGLSEGKKVVKTRDQMYEVTEPLVVIEKKLPEAYFMRVHRSYIVNTSHMKEVQPWFNSTYNLHMTDGSIVPVSRTYAKELKKSLLLE
ncbi:DNA-binding response regulator [Bacillus altitudinis]|uniref:LytR/AlgR family response regulator transcription factor n=1 Tax=Bacillus TaxID=1386 RepID=UPI000C248529|nr:MULTISPECIES: LytTR family transcriptional regulator DNA-binding domain-containing protein [Bacillus]MDH6597985.1 two-component system response regulator LytT [Bacillus aerius]PJI12309.1 DNA-binding response regulator [Bacillus altitudinis]PKQ85678.1 DNA-binding response regulator [Bacillus altitudinis]